MHVEQNTENCLSLQSDVISEDDIARIVDLIEPWFIFSLVWSFGATCDSDGRIKFSTWLRKKMEEEKVGPPDLCCLFAYTGKILVSYVIIC